MRTYLIKKQGTKVAEISDEDEELNDTGGRSETLLETIFKVAEDEGVESKTNN